MKVLISGGYGFFCTYLIERLKREGYDIYILSGESKESSYAPSCKHTAYPYPAHSPNIKQIFKSVSPDAVIHLGAADESHWKCRDNSEATNFIAGLLNMLLLSSEFAVKKFILISSYEVYGTENHGPLLESSETKPVSIKGTVIQESENLCKTWKRNYNLDCVSLRFSSVYGPRQSDFQSVGTVSYMMNNLLSGKSISISDSKTYSLIYIGDAVDAVYRALGTTVSDVLNVCGNEIVTDKLLLAAIEKECGIAALEVENIVTEDITVIMDNSQIKKELDWVPLYDLESGIARTVQWINASQKEIHSQTGKKPEKHSKKNFLLKPAFKKFNPFVENVVLFAITAMISQVLRNHPISTIIDFPALYILFIAVMFGIRQSSIAVILSSGLYIARQIEEGFDIAGVMMNFNTLLKITQFFIVGVAAGYTLDRKKLLLDSKTDELKRVQEELAEVTRISDENIRIKQTLEDRLIGYNDSFARLYSIAVKLDVMEPERIIPAALDIITTTMKSKDVAIYSVSNRGGYLRLAASTSSDSARLGKSIHLDSLPELGSKLKRHDIFTNQKMLEHMPLMAAPVSSGGRLISVIMVWDMPFDRITLYHMNLLRTITALISSSIERAYVYMEALKTSRYVGDTMVLNADAFNQILSAKKHSKEMKVSDYTVIEILNEENIDKIAGKISSSLRESDHIGFGHNGKLYVLLSNSGKDDCEVVLSRLKKSDIYSKVVNQ